MLGWILGFGVFLGVSYGCYWIAFYNPESRHKEAIMTRSRRSGKALEALDREMERLPYEQIQIRSRDGILLSGRYYHVEDGKPLHIQFHGYRGGGVRDFSAGNAVVRSMGHNSLVVDQRAHGCSQGDTMTFGIRERWDCQSWAEYAMRRFGPEVPVFLSGVSMGAATVLMAAELELPPNVVGFIADCPYSSPGAIIRKVCWDLHIPGWVAYPFVAAGALVFGHFCLWSSRPVEAVCHARKPVLLIHGSEDKYVPCAMSIAIHDACPEKSYLEIFPGAAHGGSCLTDPTRYRKVLTRFTDVCMGLYSSDE